MSNEFILSGKSWKVSLLYFWENEGRGRIFSKFKTILSTGNQYGMSLYSQNIKNPGRIYNNVKHKRKSITIFEVFSSSSLCPKLKHAF